MIDCLAFSSSASASALAASRARLLLLALGDGDLLADARDLDGLLLGDERRADDLLLLDRRRLERLLPVDLGGLDDLVLVDLGLLLPLLRRDLRLALARAACPRARRRWPAPARCAPSRPPSASRSAARSRDWSWMKTAFAVSAVWIAAYSATLRAWSASACFCCCSSMSCRIRASTFCDWICVLLLALDLVGLLAVGLHALGDGAQALGVEHVVLVELLHRAPSRAT